MKKVISLLLVLVFALIACGNSEGTVTAESLQPTETAENTVQDEAEAKIEVAESYPTIVLENEILTITVEDKFSDGSAFMNFGYDITIENKCDKYIMVVPVHCSVDGFMLSLYESPHIDNHTVSPNMKAKAKIFYSNNTEDNSIVRSVDDLTLVNGQWQVSFSDDGKIWNSWEFYDFEYILP